METQVRAATLTHFLDVAQALDYRPHAALRSVGLSAALLADPERLIPASSVVRLLEHAALNSGCDSFGLRMAQSRQLSNLGVVSLLISHQPTLRAALATTIAHRHLLNDSLAMHMQDSGDHVVVREEVMSELPARQATELALGVLHRICGAVLGRRWRPLSVCFRHSAPAQTHLHQSLFACPLVFDAAFNGMVIAAADLDLANPAADAVMVRYARQFVDTLHRAPHPSAVSEVRKAVYLMLPSGRATCQRVAQGLNCSTRTLQRRLHGADLSFGAILDDVRRELVKRYLANPNYSIAQLSELLGFGRGTSFHRWFTGLFGQAPSRYRARLLAQPQRDAAAELGAKPVTKRTRR